jgi:AcrR family transcriptional regulator
MDRYRELIKGHRPELSDADADLLAGALVGVLCGQSSARPQMAKRRLEAVLTRLLTALSETELATPAEPEVAEHPRRGGSPPVLPMPRREQMLTEAVRLFDERGFQSVGIDEIGEAVGTSGPNVYKHFANKDDILVAAMIRAGERRDAAAAEALAEALASEAPPQEAMDGLLRTYVNFARANSHLIGLLNTEVAQLPEQYRRRTLHGQREYTLLWSRMLETVRPGMDPTEARIGVGAVLNMIGYMVRTFPPSVRPDLADRLFELGSAVLDAV